MRFKNANLKDVFPAARSDDGEELRTMQVMTPGHRPGSLTPRADLCRVIAIL
jgi:hypothetical protein